MPNLVSIRRALLSVSDKTDLVPFARHLADRAVEIISTGGTAAVLKEAGIDVTAIEAVTGFPEMMDGRIKTLHPAVHGGLLARRDLPAHVEAMTQHGIQPIDLVCINLYPFERTAGDGTSSPAEVIEQIDIGGPAMLRSAAKNHASVTVVTSPAQYEQVISGLQQHDGATTLELRTRLATAAFTRTAEYDAAISAWMSKPREEGFPARLRLAYERPRELRYGENPHQAAAVYVDPLATGPSVVSAEILHGKPLSYNNLNDAAAALQLVQDLHDAAPGQACAAIIKHTNACGAATAATLPLAFDRAYDGDPLAAFGGILAANCALEASTAEAICTGQKFLEVIIAPAFAPEAEKALASRWKNVRLLAVGETSRPPDRVLDFSSIPGGMLVQETDAARAAPNRWRHAAGPALDADGLRGAAFAWMVTKHLKSNAVAIACEAQLLGAGAGQMDRVGACRIAVEKAGARMKGRGGPVVAGSDAFFPFKDGPEVLIDAGVTCIVHPGGSKRDDETLELCEERGVTCLLTGIRHFRH